MIQASDFTLISSNRDLTGHSRESDDIAIHSTKTQKTAWQQCSSWHLNNKGQHSINIYSEHKVLLRWIKTLGVGFKGFRVQAQFNTVPEGGGHSYGITITIIVNYNYVNLSVFNTNSKGQRLAHKHHVTWKFPHTDSLGLQLCRLPHAHGHVQIEACAYMCTQRHCTRTHVHTHAHAYTNAHTRFHAFPDAVQFLCHEWLYIFQLLWNVFRPKMRDLTLHDNNISKVSVLWRWKGVAVDHQDMT